MILKCITNWMANQTTVLDKISTDKAEASFTRQWNLCDPALLPETSSNLPSAVTMMGPPKQYFGESIKDRYAFMMYEAASLLHRYGFHTNIPLHRQSTSKNQRRDHRQRVSGMLGFLLNDMDSTRQIAVFDQGDVLVAYLSFVAYTQPWLKVDCVPLESSHSIDMLRQVFSKDFFLVDLFHESKTTSIPVSSKSSINKHSNKTSEANIIVKMTTGVVSGTTETTGTPKEEILTKFVLQAEDGTVLCRAIWSYASERLDTAGPALEGFNASTVVSGLYDMGLLLSIMEDAVIHIFAPIVAFRVRISCPISDTDALTWFSRQGYTETKRDRFDLCKAFVLF